MCRPVSVTSLHNNLTLIIHIAEVEERKEKQSVDKLYDLLREQGLSLDTPSLLLLTASSRRPTSLTRGREP